MLLQVSYRGFNSRWAGHGLNVLRLARRRYRDEALGASMFRRRPWREWSNDWGKLQPTAYDNRLEMGSVLYRSSSSQMTEENDGIENN